MKHKTNELEGVLLDCAVAVALGWKWRTNPHGAKGWACNRGEWDEAIEGHRLDHLSPWGGHWVNPTTPSFSSDWQEAGQIIERERMAVMPRDDGDPWRAALWLPPDASVMVYGTGPTPLIAAMRAFVFSKFGLEVELP